ncbi:hypothetical protein N780_15605 [Pontibacillus chungwhensis BH030062]|uniref:OmpR/PhoB-type domain-containing protein n=1 Tax=Pontibacillus chungwhensis BH030062 TaxID=1385513 RepID=A0A0A2VEA6_9BACI|nr:winged helix-turn-helix domain-containing protein [Pontibacillus chungwhensis]KGP91990.1 hypothetical protein N780_15605 [Pontibacillus chungwhensis BH030062]
MGEITLFHNEGVIKYRTYSIQLLPREFQLFQYLYKWPSRIFTRDELLDAVWNLEAPTDRTVDDHIYRVRKKLKPLSSVVEIETVRGKGYRLRVHKETQVSPLSKDGEVSTNVKTLFHKYHLYGQGDALKVLEENQSVFGVTLDPQSRLYLQFMKGDIKGLVETEEVTFWEKCYYLLHIYSYIQPDQEKSLSYFLKAMDTPKMPSFHKDEIRLLNRIPLLIFTKHLEEAEQLLQESKKEIYDKKLEGFIPLLYLAELYLAFLKESGSVIEEKLLEMEQLLVKYPYSREQSTFFIIKGIYYLYKNDHEGAERWFQKGFKQFTEASYAPGELISVNLILFFMKEFNSKGNITERYQHLMDQYAQRFHFSDLEQKIYKQLHDHLG